jgi:hypothetical protein
MKLADMTFDVGEQAMAVGWLLSRFDIDDDGAVTKKYVNIRTSPWYNGREKGLVFTAIVNSDCLHIAVFEHRNSDNICALRWEAPIDINPPTLKESLPLAYPSDSKWNVAHSVGYGEIGLMADWVKAEMNEWVRNKLDS